MVISFKDAEIHLDSASVKILICTRRIRNFWTIFLYLDTGRLVGELEMSVYIFLVHKRENKVDSTYSIIINTILTHPEDKSRTKEQIMIVG